MVSFAKPKNKKLIIGILGLILSAIASYYLSGIVDFFIDITKKDLSTDHYLEPKTIFTIKGLILFTILMTASLSLLALTDIFSKFLEFIRDSINIQKAKTFFLTDEICISRYVPVFLFLTGTILAFLYHFYAIMFTKPPTEGFFENANSLLLLISTIILLVTAAKINAKLFSQGLYRRIIFSLVIISGILIGFFGEEISWGQRIFGYGTPDIVKEYNVQNEFTFHNLFNPLFKFMYPAVGINAFIILFFLWVFRKENKSFLFKLLIPPPSLFFLVLIMTCSSFNGHSEIFEELLSLFFFLYSIRLSNCLSSPNRDMISPLK